MARTYRGDNIEIGFDLGRCVHSRNCFLSLPQVFDPDRRPWVDADAAPAEEIAAMIRTCPSGALTFTRTDGGAAERAPGRNRAQVLENGPLALAGNLLVDGRPATRATLCRCGQSANKPFCDYAHVAAGFTATGEPQTDKPDNPAPSPDGPLEARPVENGPLALSGAVELISGTGHRIVQGERMFLCRCGQSKSKPFCDGSHKDAGFEAPGPSAPT